MKLLKFTTLLSLLISLVSCDYLAQMEQKAEKINSVEVASLHLSKENRALQSQIADLNYQMNKIKVENDYLKLKVTKLENPNSKRARSIASVAPVSSNDLVKFSVYKWKPEQLQSMAQKEFKSKNYEKSAQFYSTLIGHYGKNKNINDELLFKAAVASYESKKHNDWSEIYFSKIMKKYPHSKYYRGAKMWHALTKLRMGDTAYFFQTVEEFRKKYRNTPEWKLMSVHYEKFVQKYKP